MTLKEHFVKVQRLKKQYIDLQNDHSVVVKVDRNKIINSIYDATFELRVAFKNEFGISIFEASDVGRSLGYVSGRNCGVDLPVHVNDLED